MATDVSLEAALLQIRCHLADEYYWGYCLRF
jgi:hypothetical protein